MQVYLCDGPKEGHVIEVPSFQPITFLNLSEKVAFRGSPHFREFEKAFSYTIHTYGEIVTIDQAECWAFPDWKFVTWSLKDLEWARFFCRKTACDVVERREIQIGSIGQATVRDVCHALDAVQPAKEYAKIYDQPPRGFVWPVEYHQPQPTTKELT